MATLHVRNVPDDLYARLQRRREAVPCVSETQEAAFWSWQIALKTCSN